MTVLLYILALVVAIIPGLIGAFLGAWSVRGFGFDASNSMYQRAGFFGAIAYGLSFYGLVQWWIV